MHAFSAGEEDALSETKHYGLFDDGGSVWNNPEFIRRFEASFLSETSNEPHVTLEEQKTLQKLSKAMAKGNTEKAKRLLQSAIGPQASSRMDYELGNLFFQGEQTEKAAAAYTTAVEKFPKFLRAWKNLGNAQLRLKDFRGATKSLSRVIELGGADSWTYGTLGLCYLDLKKAIPAESALRMATLLDSDALDWKYGLVKSFSLQQRYGDAQALLGELIAEQPDNGDLWLIQAKAFLGLGEPMKAAENLEFVDRMGLSTPESLNNLGDIYINQKLFSMAVPAYVRSLEMERPTSFSRVTRAARALSANEDFDGVLRLVAETKRLHGDALTEETQQDLLRLEAGVALARGEAAEEAKLLKEIIRLNPLDGEALVYLGQHSDRSGDSEQAIFYYERAANLVAFEAEAKRRHGQLLVRLERYADALVLLKRAQDLKPSSALQDYIDQVEKVAKSA